MKKAADAGMRQAVSTATREYDKKWKCVELEKVEREKAMIILFVGCLVNWIHPCFLVVNGISSFGVKYLETDKAESRNHTESDIPVSRLLTVALTTLVSFGDAPKLWPRNQVLVTPDGDSTTAEHPTNSLKTCLQEEF
jgi:hypothetical protein